MLTKVHTLQVNKLINKLKKDFFFSYPNSFSYVFCPAAVAQWVKRKQKQVLQKKTNNQDLAVLQQSIRRWSRCQRRSSRTDGGP